ncbi:MAG: hypothetical protein EBY39_12505 [Flavobacteriia bacterium]|nr:hypothetical protein [Flavobacteriia bacterium]
MTISDQKHRNGFISNNNDVQVNQFDQVSATYGANDFGQKGVANHRVLKNMFSMPEGFDDLNLSVAFLSGRGSLESGPDLNTGTFASNLAQGVSAFFSGDENEAANRTSLSRSLRAAEDFEELTADQSPLEGDAFNPDFQSGSISFFYNDKSQSINRSKDGIALGIKAPNASFAKQGLEDPETPVEYLSPLDGQGGFGNPALENKTSPAEGETVATIIKRYRE